MGIVFLSHSSFMSPEIISRDLTHSGVSGDGVHRSFILGRFTSMGNIKEGVTVSSGGKTISVTLVVPCVLQGRTSYVIYD